MVTRIELRVHAGAPSTQADDERHREHAETYLDVSWHVTTRISIQDNGAPNTAGTTPYQEPIRSDEPILDDTTETHDTTVYVEDTQLALTVLESHITSSAKLLRPSKTPRKRQAEYDVVTASPYPIPATDDLIRTRAGTYQHSTPSPYLKTPVLDYESKRRRTERTPGSPTAQRRNETSYIPAVEDGNIGIAFVSGSTFQTPQHDPDFRAIGSQLSHAANETTSELPSSYSLSKLTSESSISKPRLSQRSTSDPGTRIGSYIEQREISLQSSSQSREIRSPVAGDVSTNLPPQQTEPVLARDGQPQQSKASSTASAIPTTRHQVLVAMNLGSPPSAADILAVKQFPLMVRPPDPDTSIAQFTTHLTPLLSHLAGLPVAEAWKPVFISRDLRTWERGSWIFDTSSWSLTVQVSFWKEITQHMESGAVGWGVWCSREVPSSSRLPPEVEILQPSLGIVRVYCWGEVVRHVYLLLYSASHSRVRMLGLQWVDADEEVIVQMRGS